MPTNIFVNLPVVDLPRSTEFFSKLGYDFNEQFSDETAASMVVSDNIYVMLLSHDKFQQFTSRKISDGHSCSEVMVALSVDSRNDVDEHVATALDNGAVEARRSQDYGWMYGRAFHDLDGHIWEIIWMDQSYVK